MIEENPKGNGRKSKTFIPIILVPIVLLADAIGAYCYFFGFPGFARNPDDLESIAVSSKLKPQKAADELMSKYLAGFTSFSVDLQSRITKFQINDLQLVDGSDGYNIDGKQGFDFTVDYNVRMDTIYSDWAAGNGEQVLGFWMFHKAAYVTVEKQGNQYVITDIGTGP